MEFSRNCRCRANPTSPRPCDMNLLSSCMCVCVCAFIVCCGEHRKNKVRRKLLSSTIKVKEIKRYMLQLQQQLEGWVYQLQNSMGRAQMMCWPWNGASEKHFQRVCDSFSLEKASQCFHLTAHRRLVRDVDGWIRIYLLSS